ncbi:uncharacterized protein MONOS_7328 [Monocercomonoides exilis]|uniref:uncharacterized protein n=1 Tax=Monocercomonoides exilis TaxID=2049356 RepID=UPI00355A10AA|nr:hypothetical protein MONOS_7328 [Monocercomonoides exilis]|eukprot:MONOS_7328.1-p1 / transcript=MONOS_7328.1 / gene=MONOS_7328 / organism=Monocercomonoides_exilis_PA203 / gene_product=unspecified product / transcript_product=unspecified product / location=Mono_scaffold00248:12617-13681(+) / protein_length=314 / sequence_SO=supercontig / SO=protein_coding / is_pseudo=false
MSKQEYSQFSTSVHEVFHELEDQFREIDEATKKLEADKIACQKELDRLLAANSKQQELIEATEYDRQQILKLKQTVIELKDKISHCAAADQEAMTMQAIKDREIKRLRQIYEGGEPNLANYIKAERAAKIEASKFEEAKKRSERSLELAKEEVAELENRLTLLASKLEADLEHEHTSERTAVDFLALHLQLLSLSRQTNSLQAQLIQQDEDLEDKEKKRARAQKMKENIERQRKLVRLEEAKLEEIKRRAKAKGVKLPEWIEDEEEERQLMENEFGFGEADLVSSVQSPGFFGSPSPQQQKMQVSMEIASPIE